MMTFFKNYKAEAKQATPQSNRRLSLTRVFVETGDERCPLAGIWSRLPEMDAAVDDEPGLTQPAWGVFLYGALSWRAHPLFRYLPFTGLQYGID
jgi:hypothetical protein